MLSRDQILQANDLPREEIQVPEWNGSVIVRTMSGSERDAFEARHSRDQSKDLRARFAAAVICDDNGNAMFTEADIAALGKKSAAALDRVFEAGIRLSKVTSADVEQLRGNSNATPSDGSASDSPPTSDVPSASSSPVSAPTS